MPFQKIRHFTLYVNKTYYSEMKILPSRKQKDDFNLVRWEHNWPFIPSLDCNLKAHIFCLFLDLFLNWDAFPKNKKNTLPQLFGTIAKKKKCI